MILRLQRLFETRDSVLGQLSMDDVWECHTLELPLGDGGHGYAIPEGTYPLMVNWSPRFNNMMMRVLNVPGRDGILIHKGNGPENTEGCILVGREFDGARIKAGTSTPAYDFLYGKVCQAQMKGDEITLEVSNKDLKHFEI